jgi:hypothetical protein
MNTREEYTIDKALMAAVGSVLSVASYFGLGEQVIDSVQATAVVSIAAATPILVWWKTNKVK